MTINPSSHDPDHRNMSSKQRVFKCKVNSYSVHCGRVQVPQQNGSIFRGISYSIGFDEVDTLTDDPVRFVRLLFHTQDPGWLGDLNQGDGYLHIRVMLPYSEFAQYYDLLRDEKDVYFTCAFDQKPDDSTGEMRWFDLTNRNPGGTSSQVEK